MKMTIFRQDALVGGAESRKLILLFPVSCLLLTAYCLLLTVCPAYAQSEVGIINSKHNMSVTGPGELKALTETSICIFCHTPHNAAPQTPLWNKSIEPLNYILY